MVLLAIAVLARVPTRGLAFTGIAEHPQLLRLARAQTCLRTFAVASASEDDDTAPSSPRSDAAWSSQEAMKRKLRQESEYPLKFPLLGASVVIAGKGATDALVTVAKVSAGIRGASLSETFAGVPVLAIDAFCVVLGVALGVFTWRTMRSTRP